MGELEPIEISACRALAAQVIGQALFDSIQAPPGSRLHREAWEFLLGETDEERSFQWWASWFCDDRDPAVLQEVLTTQARKLLGERTKLRHKKF
jgi:hypothetical protein